MSWLLPSALVIGALAAVGAGVLHLIARTEPRPEPFPTARFIPDRPLRARSRTIAPSDLALLALRVAAIVAIAAAVAGPRSAAPRGRLLRVIVLDRSRHTASAAELIDSARTLARLGDVVFAFDTTTTMLATPRAVDSLAVTRAPGSLSVALAAAIGMSARLADRVDSIDLVLVSPLAAEEIDGATERIRRTWPGRIRLVPTTAAPLPPLVAGVESTAPGDDPVVAALDLASAHTTSGFIRLVRDEPTAGDSAWAREADHVLLHWPANAAAWRRRVREDTVGGVATGNAVIVGQFPRPWTVDGRTVARWVDGEPAVVEHSSGQGCIRDVAVLLDPASDLTLRAPFRRFLRGLLMPCGGARDRSPISPTQLTQLAGQGGPVSTSALSATRRDSPWTIWLLLLGAALLVAELRARRTRSAAP